MCRKYFLTLKAGTCIRRTDMTLREEYELESAVRGFHVYKPTWTPVIGEELTIIHDPTNSIFANPN